MDTEQKSGGFKIFPQVLLTMFLVALIPLAGFWFINNTRVQREMQASAEQNLQDASTNLSTKVEGWVDTNVRLLDQNAALPDMTSMNTERQTPLLKAINETYEWTYLIMTTDAQGQNVGRSDDGEAKSYEDRAYVQQVMEGQANGRQVLISKTTGEPAVCLSGPIERQGAVNGALVACSELNEVSKAVTDVQIGETGFAILVDDQNNVIAHGDLNLNESAAETEGELLNISDYPALSSGTLGQQSAFKVDGRDVVTYTEETALGWKLIVQQDYADAFASVIAARRNALILLLATVLFVVIVALLLARRLVRPIENLTQAAEDMSRGELGVYISETDRSDEIGALARSVERMGVSIKMAFDELGTSKA